MKSRQLLPPLVSLAVFCLGLALAAPPARGQKRGIELNVGPEYRQVKTSFFKNVSGSSYNTWETHKLTGLTGEMLIHVVEQERPGLQAGIGLGLYAVGAYGYEVRSFTGTGPGGGFGFSIDGIVQGSYVLSPRARLLARIGGGYLQLSASGADAQPVPFDSDFSTGVPDLYAGGGFQYTFSPRLVALAMARIAVADLGSWTDYSSDLNNMSGYGVNAMLGFRL